MRGLGIRIYTDEDVPAQLAEQLQRRGYDAISCREAGNSNQALPDEWQLGWTAERGRSIVVFNVAHFLRLDSLWKLQDRSHAGIIMAEHRWSFSELLRRSINHLDTVPPEEQFDIARYLAG
jgi:predicted nuclease of predicted toxin-antitoxin system